MATGRHSPGSLPIQNTEVPDVADGMAGLNVTEGGGEINVLDLSRPQQAEPAFTEYFPGDKWDRIKDKDANTIKSRAEEYKEEHDDLLRNFIEDELRDFPDSFCELPDRIRIMLLGKTGTGKSSTANTICGEDWFETSVSAQSLTIVNQVHAVRYKGKKIQILDTPGLIDTNRGPEEVAKEIAKVVEVFPDGVHAFVCILNISSPRFTDEDREAVQQIKDIFGPDIIQRTFLLFTHAASVLKGRMALSDYIARQADGSPLRNLINDVHGRVLAFENDSGVRYVQTKQRDMFFTMLNFLMKQVGYSVYTNSMFRMADAQRAERQLYLKQIASGVSRIQDTITESFQRWTKEQQEFFRTELNEALTGKLESALEKAGLCNSADEKVEEQMRLFAKKKLTHPSRAALEPLVKCLPEQAQQYFSENPHIMDTIFIEYINKKYDDFEKLTKYIENEIKTNRSGRRWWCSIL